MVGKSGNLSGASGDRVVIANLLANFSQSCLLRGIHRIFAHIGEASQLDVLTGTQFLQQPAKSLRWQIIFQLRPHDLKIRGRCDVFSVHFDDVPACSPENAFQLLNDFAIAPATTNKALQIAVDDKVQAQLNALEERLGTKLDSQHGILVALIDRVRSLDNEIIRQDTLVKTILGVPQLIDSQKIAKAERDDQRKD